MPRRYFPLTGVLLAFSKGKSAALLSLPSPFLAQQRCYAVRLNYAVLSLAARTGGGRMAGGDMPDRPALPGPPVWPGRKSVLAYTEQERARAGRVASGET